MSLINLTYSLTETGLCAMTISDIMVKQHLGCHVQRVKSDPFNDIVHKRREATKRRFFYVILSHLVI